MPIEVLEQAKGGSKRILIIEDDSAIASVYCDKFAREGFLVSYAQDGAEGLQLAAGMRPDIVLLDLHLPTMDGFEVLKQLRAQSATMMTPVIVWTNLSEPEDRERVQAYGIADYLIKVNHMPSDVVARVKAQLGLS